MAAILKTINEEDSDDEAKEDRDDETEKDVLRSPHRLPPFQQRITGMKTRGKRIFYSHVSCDATI